VSAARERPAAEVADLGQVVGSAAGAVAAGRLAGDLRRAGARDRDGRATGAVAVAVAVQARAAAEEVEVREGGVPGVGELQRARRRLVSAVGEGPRAERGRQCESQDHGGDAQRDARLHAEPESPA